MTNNDFNEIVKEFLEKTEKVLVKKEGEYSLDTDRFSFFKRMAQIEGGTPEQALLHCMTKHITSFIDMVQSGEKYSKELWFDKLGDITNYCILLYGLLQDDEMFKDLDKTKKAIGVKLNEEK